MYVIENKEKLISSFLIVYLLFGQLALIVLDSNNQAMFIGSILIWFIGMIGARKSFILLLFFAFIFPYVFVPFYSFFEGKQLSVYSAFQSIEVINKVSFINSVFVGVFSILVYGCKDRYLQSFKDRVRPHTIVFYLSLIPAIISLIFGITGQDILSSSYGSGNMSKSTLHEYFLAFIIIPLVYLDKNNKVQLFIIYLIIGSYILKTISFGGRVEVVQLCILVGAILFDYFRNISKKILFTGLIVAYVIMDFVGFMRTELVNYGLYSDVVGAYFERWFNSTNQSEFVVTTSSDVFYSSMRILGLINDGSIDLSYRIKSFLSFIFNLPLTFTVYKEYANLTTFDKSIYQSGGGGLIGVYFYTWGGYLGVVLGACFVGKIFKQMHSLNSSNILFNIYGLTLMATFARWYAYSPINLVKLCLFSVIYFFIFTYIIKLVTSRKPSV